MTENFKRPFVPPPAIFGVAFLIGLTFDFVRPWPVLPLVPQLITGISCLAIGAVLIRSSMGRISEGGTTYSPYEPSTALVTSGIYSYSRNPGYLGLAVIQLGMALLVDSIWIALTGIIAIAITDVFVIRAEEEKLTRTFGDEYTAYLGLVRRWI